MLKTSTYGPILFRFFQRARTQFNLSLGIGEFNILLGALEKGKGFENLLELKRLCEVIWLKSITNRSAFQTLFDECFQEELEIANLDLLALKQRKKFQKEQVGKQGFPSAQKEGEKQTLPKSISTSKSQLPKEIQPETYIKREIIEEEIGVFMDTSADNRTGVAISEMESLPSIPKLNHKYRFSDAYLPLSQREIQYGWRFLKNTTRFGSTEEIDVPATISEIARTGIFSTPAYMPSTKNRSRMCLLIDQGDGMAAFESLSQCLAQSLQQDELGDQSQVYYFTEFPLDYLYKTPDYLSWDTIIRVFKQAAQAYTRMLILSDGGAAKGDFDQELVYRMRQFIKTGMTHFAQIAWFNPMPKHRWKATSAEEIAQLVPMFEATSKGFELAINRLKGK